MFATEWGDKVRCVVLGEYLIEHCATVRNAAAVFGISKSTVHKDVTQTLKEINRALFEEVQKVLQKNKQERHLRGGEATKNKYSAMKKQSKKKKGITHGEVCR